MICGIAGLVFESNLSAWLLKLDLSLAAVLHYGLFITSAQKPFACLMRSICVGILAFLISYLKSAHKSICVRVTDFEFKFFVCDGEIYQTNILPILHTSCLNLSCC